jgi:proteasome lid subunit RPN8/RPN11
MFQWLSKLVRWWRGDRTATAPSRLARITLTDGITKTLFEDYAEHRRSERGDEEIGWILLGIRQGSEAIALAALPAGAHRDAGAAHIRFNSDAQAVGCRILRQHDKRLQIIGVVHTHPGSLRQPSGGEAPKPCSASVPQMQTMARLAATRKFTVSFASTGTPWAPATMITARCR